jgi:hypothetical protein
LETSRLPLHGMERPRTLLAGDPQAIRLAGTTGPTADDRRASNRHARSRLPLARSSGTT